MRAARRRRLLVVRHELRGALDAFTGTRATQVARLSRVGAGRC